MIITGFDLWLKKNKKNTDCSYRLSTWQAVFFLLHNEWPNPFFFSESSCWLDWSWEHLTIWRLCLPVAHSKQWCEMTALKAFCSCLINWKVITWRQEVLFVNEDVWLLIRPPERVMLSTRRIKAHQAQSWRILFWSRVHGVNLEVRDGKRIIVS